MSRKKATIAKRKPVTDKRSLAERDEDGRYTYSQDERLCVCGHQLGHHGARTRLRNGSYVQGCLIGTGDEADELYPPLEQQCQCAHFRPKTKRRK